MCQHRDLRDGASAHLYICRRRYGRSHRAPLVEWLQLSGHPSCANRRLMSANLCKYIVVNRGYKGDTFSLVRPASERSPSTLDKIIKCCAPPADHQTRQRSLSPILISSTATASFSLMIGTVPSSINSRSVWRAAQRRRFFRSSWVNSTCADTKPNVDNASAHFDAKIHQRTQTLAIKRVS